MCAQVGFQFGRFGPAPKKARLLAHSHTVSSKSYSLDLWSCYKLYSTQYTPIFFFFKRKLFRTPTTYDDGDKKGQTCLFQFNRINSLFKLFSKEIEAEKKWVTTFTRAPHRFEHQRTYKKKAYQKTFNMESKRIELNCDCFADASFIIRCCM